ncbi:MAG: ComEC/Rec2 family competence protein [Sulfitobacter sp.]|jgi:competence protein ComEC|uniref:ComEC/Rec2 family competence protein n=1 Tax=unclassified Sulfitobacter TaxID=196795 RepID=UPI0007C3B0D4|nr:MULTISPECIES: ComEC/Rec2 family competence protein [unclassified Sulfitobacter]KZX97463.1 competence protein [Sulfitobacter sp. HI0021]KZY01511.1 competence protein [Sulfitobacter sp. HI0027]KZY99567.1 competence protein [Sulfitobacter sp. HI0076]
MGLWNQFSTVMLRQRGHLFGWVPVCLALGIGWYFSLAAEPSAALLWATALAAAALAVVARALPEVTAPFAVGVALVLLGLLLAAFRAHSMSAPVLGWRYYGAVEGRVVALDRSQSDAPRITLDQVRLERVPPARTPSRVRVSLHSKLPGGVAPKPGMLVMTTAHLSPPAGPVEPGGFDFQRHAWFAGLGAVGYARVPLLGIAEPAERDPDLALFRLRMAASARVRAHLPGDIGGFAAAITTGDRSAISQAALQNLRSSNLAHLLAISGLHMGLLSAVVFGAARLILALHPVSATGWPSRSIAAAAALIAATGYLALSGGNVATERAYIMCAVALCALMIGRRAISLRAVAVAGIIVLTLRPEALMGPGFQMSFAATTALVAVFGWMRDFEGEVIPKRLRPVAAIVISSAVAGFATAPISAAHFNTVAHYGLVANLLSVPLMGVLVIPAAVLAAILAPIGGEGLPLWAMGLGLRWILSVADLVAHLPGARSFVPGPGGWVLPLLSLGFLWLILWQGRMRWLGGPAMLLSFALWQGATRPDVLVADTGTLVGVMTPAGRALSKERGAGFVARNWLENDGDGVDQAMAAQRWAAQEDRIIHLSGKRAVAAFTGCQPEDIVVASVEIKAAQAWGCPIYDPVRLRETGALALTKSSQGWQITTARDRAGLRLWNSRPKRQ